MHNNMDGIFFKMKKKKKFNQINMLSCSKNINNNLIVILKTKKN